jgi:Zn-dependent protease/CBS domain-containing protein
MVRKRNSHGSRHEQVSFHLTYVRHRHGCALARVFDGTRCEATPIMASPSGNEIPVRRRRRSWWTWNLGRVAGIPIRVHFTLVLLLAWIATSYALGGASFGVAAVGVLLVATIFAVIVIHELAHALLARRYGVATHDIMLLPIGGVASLERMPEKPRQELAVALVGPAVNIVLAGLLWIGIELAGGTTRLADATTIGGAFAAQLLWINIALAVFNLIPAFPMDGGRALRALLSWRIGYERATNIAAALGRVFAVAIGVFGFMYNPLLILIALVVWMGATQERALVELRSAVAGVPVSAAMLRRVEVVTPDQPLEEAAALLVRGGLNQLPVIDHGAPVGVITRSDVATTLAHAGPEATVSEAPQHHILTVSPAEPLDQVLDRLRAEPEAVALVIDHGAPVGVLTAEHLAAYVALHQHRAV